MAPDSVISPKTSSFRLSLPSPSPSSSLNISISRFIPLLCLPLLVCFFSLSISPYFCLFRILFICLSWSVSSSWSLSSLSLPVSVCLRSFLVCFPVSLTTSIPLLCFSLPSFLSPPPFQPFPLHLPSPTRETSRPSGGQGETPSQPQPLPEVPRCWAISDPFPSPRELSLSQDPEGARNVGQRAGRPAGGQEARTPPSHSPPPTCLLLVLDLTPSLTPCPSWSLRASVSPLQNGQTGL